MGFVVLLSGGMDSTIAYYHTLRRALVEGGPVHAVAFDYGQRHIRELLKARNIWADSFLAAGSQYANVRGQIHTKVLSAMPHSGSLLGRGRVKHYSDVKSTEGVQDSAFIPYRNLLFLTVGAMWARQWHCVELVTGLRGGIPDCTEAFEEQVNRALLAADPDYLLTVSSPVHISREESVRLAQSIPGCLPALAATMSCFEGGELPCGSCLACIKRAEGFEKVGIADPLLERLARKAGG